MIPDSLFPAFLSQLVQVSCVALLAILVTRWTRGSRPHLVHAVWLIVFLKCITPPVLSSPTSPFPGFKPPFSTRKETAVLTSCTIGTMTSKVKPLHHRRSIRTLRQMSRQMQLSRLAMSRQREGYSASIRSYKVLAAYFILHVPSNFSC